MDEELETPTPIVSLGVGGKTKSAMGGLISVEPMDDDNEVVKPDEIEPIKGLEPVPEIVEEPIFEAEQY